MSVRPRPAHGLRLLFVLALAVVGCERPFVETEPVVLAETTPDLSVVQMEEVLPLRLRVSDAEGVERVTVNGEAATRSPVPDLFLDTLRLQPGLNTFFVAVFDDEGNVTEDTLHAAYLPYGVGPGPPLPLPRYEHTATTLADGSILIAGGFEGGGANASALLAREITGLVTYTPLPHALNHPRGGHTATLLPDGRVLLLGGANRNAADEPSDFVSEVELYDPTTSTFALVPVEGEPLRRYEHAAIALERDGRVFVYAYGGLEAGVGGVAPTGSLVVLELREEDGEDRLTAVSPPGGIGGLLPAYGHAFVPLPSHDGLPSALSVGAALDVAEPYPFALRLTFRPSSTFFPFEIETEPARPPDEPLVRFGTAAVMPGLVLLSGGETPDSGASGALRLYADAAGRFFTFPEDDRLRFPRSGHTATLLPSGRILVIGGVSTGSEVLAQTELIGPN